MVPSPSIALLQTSKLNLIPSVNITFMLNDAEDTGGALYVDDDSYTCMTTLCHVGGGVPLLRRPLPTKQRMLSRD